MLPDWRTVLSAALIVFAFPPWDLRFLIWIALIPWFSALRDTPTPKAAFIQGVWLSFFMSIGGFFWVAYVLKQFGGLPWPLAILGLLLYSLWGQPQFLIFAPFWKATGLLNRSRGLGLTLAVALGYAGIDWVLPKLFVDTLGHSQYSARWLRQIADIGGAALLTFLVFFVNDALWQLWSAIRKRTEPSIWPALHSVSAQAAMAALLVIAASLYGKLRLEQVEALTAAAPRHVQGAIIQANIGDFDKVAAERGIRGAANQIVNRHLEMSNQALGLTPKPDFIVWPETSYPSTFRTPSTSDELARDQKLESFVRTTQTPLLFGGYDHRQGKDFNAFFLLTPSSDPSGVSVDRDLQTYHKNILLLFGEYLPGSEQFAILKQWFPQVGNFGRGIGPDVQKIPTVSGGISVGPVICYEVLFSNYVIGAVRKGSQMILNITNDSWFGPWGEPQLHLALTTFRSVETRVPTLRGTNTGISALILPNGDITHASKIMEPEIINVRIPVMEPVWTLLKAWGDWFGPAAFVIGLIAMLAALYLRRQPAS